MVYVVKLFNVDKNIKVDSKEEMYFYELVQLFYYKNIKVECKEEVFFN